MSMEGNSETPRESINLWRITKQKHASNAFSGEGPRRFGARWNHRGTAVVYASDSLALAALELFVHLGRQGLQIRFVYFRIHVPADVSISSMDPKSLPADWRKKPPPTSTMDIGTHWADSNESAVLGVPSAIVPVGMNYLLNPNHPQYAKIEISSPEPFTLDPRMWK